MVVRPADGAGDILPVLASSDLASGAAAVARLAECRLKLLAGDWWENPAWGCEVLDLLRESRLSEEDLQALSSYLSSYIRETPGVRDVRDAAFSVSGRRYRYACTIDTGDGAAEVSYIL